MSRWHFDVGLSAALVAILLLHYGNLLGSLDGTLLIVAAFGGTLPVLWGAYHALRAREWASMDMLASLLIFV